MERTGQPARERSCSTPKASERGSVFFFFALISHRSEIKLCISFSFWLRSLSLKGLSTLAPGPKQTDTGAVVARREGGLLHGEGWHLGFSGWAFRSHTDVQL